MSMTPTLSPEGLRAWMRSLRGIVQGVTADSRQVAPGMAFAALPGTHHDGYAFIENAIAQGAVGILWEKFGREYDVWPYGDAVPQLGVVGLAQALGEIAHEIYGRPSQQLKLIGVTGTNGKTSCTHWIAQALSSQGISAAVIGTLGNGFFGALTASMNTTPDAASVHRLLAQFQQEKAQAVAMEVSSIGLEEGRVGGCVFDTAVFTNLSRDHLDYHGTQEAYAAAKARLFTWPALRHAVVNIDDPVGVQFAEMAQAQGVHVLRYGSQGDQAADIVSTDVEAGAFGLRFKVRTPAGDGQVQSALVGDFNRMNLLAVLGVLLVQGVPLDAALRALTMLIAPPGRMQRLGDAQQPTIVIDYAHTPDALDNVLRALRTSLQKSGQGAAQNGKSSGRLFCVFGCGGDRDPGKRRLMGEIAGRQADRVWITSDNPRSEVPETILAMIEEGLQAVQQAPWTVQEDRAQAIAQAIAAASPDDVVLIAGKGHELYQEIAGVRHPFSDAEVAAQALQQWRRT